MNIINQIQNDSRNRINVLSTRCRQWSKFAVASLALVVGISCTVPLQAQTVTFIGPRVRATMPVGNAGMLIISNSMAYSTNGVIPDGDGNMIIQPISLSVSGLPAGASFSLTNCTDITAPSNFVPTALRTNSSTTIRLWLTLSLDGSTPEGTYPFSLSANGGATNTIIYTLDVAHIWNSSTNAAADGAGNWSDPSKWSGNGTAGTNTDANVVFTEAGGQSNTFFIAGVITNNLIDSIVDNDATISSIRFSETNNANRYHTIQINPGKTLTITGTNGLSVLRDYVNEIGAIASGITVTFTSANGGTLVITNNKANFAILPDNLGANLCLLDLSGLDNFRATVYRFTSGDALAYPNFWNLDANNYGNRFNTSVPRRMIPNFAMAKTNIIRTSFVGPDNYTNDTSRDYAICFSRGAYGSTTTAGPPLWTLGVSNIFFADSICFNAYGSGNANTYCRFNSAPAFTNNPIAIFRGTNGGRMAMFAISDAAGTNTEVSSTKGAVDLNANRGVVDALVDRVIIAADRPLISGGSSDQPNHQGAFIFGAGIFDANTVILGYQHSGIHTNLITQDFRGYCQGTLTVTNKGVFKINKTLTLGYTTEAQNSSGPETFNNFGRVNIDGGGTLMVNTVLVGGETKNSGANSIALTSNPTNTSTLIVSNTVAGPDKALATFSMSGGSVLQLFVNGNSNAPYVYTTNLTVSAGNFIKIGSLVNVTYTGGVAQFPLISYLAGTPSIPGVIMPAGFVGSGSIIPNGSTEWDLYISTNPPNTNLLWRAPAGGTGTADWDTSTKSWLDLSTAVMTNFHNGDAVRFDDTPGFATNINQAVSILLPGQVNMSNTVLNYKFTGSGLQGGGTLTKTGTGTLQVAGTVSLPMTITQGLLTNTPAGATLGISVGAGASLVNSGTINGDVSCAGQVLNLGVINAGLTVSGVVTNLGGIQGGAFTVQDGGFLYNGTNATINNFGASTVSSNATLISDGYLGDGTFFANSVQSLTVAGTFKDTGASTLAPSMMVQTLTINPGAVFIPGGDNIGTSVAHPPSGAAVNTIPGRVVFSSGSTNLFKVDAGTLASTRVLSGFQDFGPSQSSQLQNGSTLIITNVSGTPFAAGQFFRLFGEYSVGGNPVPTGTATNAFPVIVPAKPGPGLIWDLTRLWGNDGSGNWGYIGVAKPGIVLLTNSFTLAGGTGTNWDGTNIVAQFSWPATNYGWRLQTLVTPKGVGLVASTNWDWTGIAGSWTNLSMTFSNKLSTTNTVFYRLVYP